MYSTAFVVAAAACCPKILYVVAKANPYDGSPRSVVRKPALCGLRCAHEFGPKVGGIWGQVSAPRHT